MNDRSVKQPKVAVLLAAYDGMEFIEEQVETILNQKDVDVTLFISVDRSDDGTEEWCDRLAAKNDNTECLEHGKRFGAAGPNFYRLFREVDFSKFDFVALADQDDIWHDWKLSRACNVLMNAGYSAYSSDVEAFWPDGKSRLVKKSNAQTKMDHHFEAAGPGCTYVLTVDTARAFQSLVCQEEPKELPEPHDWLIYSFCRSNSYRWYIDKQVPMRYRQHQGNQVGTNMGIRAAMSRISLLRSGWYRKQILAIAKTVGSPLNKEFADRFFLLRNWRNLRRKPSEKIVLAALILIGLY